MVFFFCYFLVSRWSWFIGHSIIKYFELSKDSWRQRSSYNTGAYTRWIIFFTQYNLVSSLHYCGNGPFKRVLLGIKTLSFCLQTDDKLMLGDYFLFGELFVDEHHTEHHTYLPNKLSVRNYWSTKGWTVGLAGW